MVRRPLSDLTSDDLLAFQRERVMYLVSIAICVSLTPFAVVNFLSGRVGLAWTVVGLVVVFGADAIALHYKKRPPIPFALVVIPAAFGISLSLSTLGIIGALWCYPAVLFFYFVLGRHLANVASVALLISSAVLVGEFVDVGVMVRFIVTLTLTIVIINIVINIISDLQQRLLDQATTDPLTGALNRRQIDVTLSSAIERFRRTKVPASVLAIDLDHFKRINDQLGHEAGDTVLKGVVNVIRNRARKLDVLFRMGGEEFMLVLPDTAESDAAMVAEQLRAAVTAMPLIEGWPLTLSVGVAGVNGHDSVDSWIKRADDSLYAAKERGRNRVVAGAMPRKYTPTT